MRLVHAIIRKQLRWNCIIALWLLSRSKGESQRGLFRVNVDFYSRRVYIRIKTEFGLFIWALLEMEKFNKNRNAHGKHLWFMI